MDSFAAWQEARASRFSALFSTVCPSTNLSKRLTAQRPDEPDNPASPQWGVSHSRLGAGRGTPPTAAPIQPGDRKPLSGWSRYLWGSLFQGLTSPLGPKCSLLGEDLSVSLHFCVSTNHLFLRVPGRWRRPQPLPLPSLALARPEARWRGTADGGVSVRGEGQKNRPRRGGPTGWAG